MSASKLLQPVHEHRLLRELEHRVRPVIKQSIEPLKKAISNGKFRVDEPPALSGAASYYVSVFTSAMALVNALDRAILAIEFARRFPSPKYYERRGITLFMWLEYQYATFATMLTTVLDTALILTNAVVSLGLEEKKCRWDNIIKHAQIKGTPIEASLREYDEATKRLQQLRQHHVHRAAEINLADVLRDEMIDGFRFFDGVKRLQLLDGSESRESALDDPILTILYNATPRKLVREMSTTVESVVPIVSKIFDALSPRFEVFTRLHDLAISQNKAKPAREA